MLLGSGIRILAKKFGITDIKYTSLNPVIIFTKVNLTLISVSRFMFPCAGMPVSKYNEQDPNYNVKIKMC